MCTYTADIMSVERNKVLKDTSEMYTLSASHHCKTWSYNQIYGHAHEPETVYMWNSQSHSAICCFVTVDI